MSQPSQLDVLTPFDVTAYTSITAAQLDQFAAGITPYSDKGFVLVTPDIAGVPQVPNAAVTQKWQNYLWIRQGATAVTAYIWNPNGATDSTFLNWVTVSSASIAPGSIQGFQIAANTIPASCIISISSSQITGSVVAGWLAQLNSPQTAYATNGLMNNTSLVFGDMAPGSTVGIPTIGSQVVTAAKIANQTITATQIANQTLTTTQMQTNGAAASTASTPGAIDPANNIIVPTTSVTGIPGSSTQAVASGDVIAVNAAKNGFVTNSRAVLKLADPSTQTYTQVPTVAPNGTTYVMSEAQGANGGLPFGRLLQKVVGSSSTKATSSGNIASVAGAPNYSAPGINAFFQQNFTPLSATSTLVVRATLNVAGTSSAKYVYAGIYLATGATAPVLTGAVFLGTVSTQAIMQQLVIEGTIANPGASAQVAYIAFGIVSSGTAYTNSIDGSTVPFGGMTSTIVIDEYL